MIRDIYYFVKSSDKFATPKFVLPSCANGIYHAIESIYAIDFNQHDLTENEQEVQDAIRYQKTFVELKFFYDGNDFEMYTYVLTEFIQETYYRITNEYLIILVEKAIVYLIAISNNIRAADCYFPEVFVKHLDKIPAIKECRNAQYQEYFGTENVVNTMLELYNRLWESSYFIPKIPMSKLKN